MSSLILVTSASGAGHLKQERFADRVLAITHRLVTGPVPAHGLPDTFLEERRSIYEDEGLFHELWWFDAEDAQEGSWPERVWSRLPDVCRQHDQITLWVDPHPNAQLLLLQLLDWLGGLPDIAPRLLLKQSESAIGERRRGDWMTAPRRVEAADVTLARAAWAAFRAPTPQAWAALRDEPGLGRLPGLPRAVETLLGELPDSTGLGATERRVLQLAERQGWWDAAEWRGSGSSARTLPETERGAQHLIRQVHDFGRRLPLEYFELGEAVCGLAAAPVPALCGLTEIHYDLALHDNAERLRRFCESSVSLTDFGRRLNTGVDDWSRQNKVHRWWGGTRLSNASLWRWDEKTAVLSAP